MDRLRPLETSIVKKDRWYNPLMRWLLRSPIHWLVSKDILLIIFTGRKTGRTYSTPINYSRHGEVIQLISNRNRAWWHNLAGGAPVSLWLRGKLVPATADIVEARGDAMIQALSDVYPGLTLARARQLAPDSVLIRLRLAEAEGQPDPRTMEHAR